jgi:eukaryotic-like serine/threonine-protein kinase
MVEMPDSWDPRASGRPPLQQPPGGPPRRRGPSTTLVVVGVGCVCLLTAGAAGIAWHLTAPPPSTTTVPVTVETSAPATAAASTRPTARPTSSTKATATAAPPRPAADDASACFAGLFPADAFLSTQSLGRLCTATDAYRGMLDLKTALVRAHDVTEAMREWSKLGWYEIAAFALARAHCCPDSGALTVASRWSSCRLEETLAWLANALDDEAARKDALAKFEDAAQCITRGGGAPQFGQAGAPYAQPDAFRTILERLRKARTK